MIWIITMSQLRQKLSTARVCLPSDYNSNCPLTSGFPGMGMFGNIKGLAYYQPGEKDPYITMDPVRIPAYPRHTKY